MPKRYMVNPSSTKLPTVAKVFGGRLAHWRSSNDGDPPTRRDRGGYRQRSAANGPPGGDDGRAAQEALPVGGLPARGADEDVVEGLADRVHGRRDHRGR